MLKSKLFREVFYQSRLPQVIGPIDMKYTMVNNAFCDFIGYTRSELELVDVQKVSHQDDFEQDLLQLQRLLSGEISEYEMEKRYYHKNGSIKVGRLIVSMIKDEECQEKFILAQIYDLTEKKQIEEDVRKSEEKYRLLAENSSDIINLHHIDGTYLYVSPSAKTILGYEAEELLGRSPFEFIHPEDGVEIYKLQNEISPSKPIVIATYRMKKKDGSMVWLESTIKMVFDEDEVPSKLISVSRDIQKRLETNALLRKSEKLAVVGQMAAAVAHEIRNPLTPIKGFMQVVQSGGVMNPEYTGIILDEIKRIEGIISEFLAIAKPQNQRKEHVSVDKMIRQVIQLLTPQAMIENKEVNYYRNEGLLNDYIIGDLNSLKQVFLNILQNGLDAIEEKGKVDVSIMIKNDLLAVKIQDNGCGIPKDRLFRMGEPFYSTKEKGTGLGLMTSYKIIEQHGGIIHFDSAEGEGTTVIVSIPLVKNDVLNIEI